MLGAAAAAEKDRRVFKFIPALANATLHRYINDLGHVRMELAALKRLDMRVREEQEVVVSCMKRVCEAAGGLGITDQTFSL